VSTLWKGLLAPSYRECSLYGQPWRCWQCIPTYMASCLRRCESSYALLTPFEQWHTGQEGRCRPYSFLFVLIIHTWKIHSRSLSRELVLHVRYPGSRLLMFLCRVVLSLLKIGWREETACTGHHGYERRVEVL